MPKRRKKRAPIAWGPVLWVLIALNVTIGVFASPVTAIRTVRIDGAEKANESYLRSVARSVRGVPALQINPHAVESKVLATSSIQTATFSRNIFGRATLRVAYRTPIARIEGQPYLFLSDSGVLFKSVSIKPDGLPRVKVFREALDANLTLAAPWPMARLAWLVEEAKKEGFGQAPTVEIGADGAVSLRENESGVVVRLGAPYELDQKLAKWKELLSADPNLFRKVRSVNLVEPTRPTIVPKE